MMTCFLGVSLRGDSSIPAPNQVPLNRRVHAFFDALESREQMDDDVDVS